jgi:hypothetical protein
MRVGDAVVWRIRYKEFGGMGRMLCVCYGMAARCIVQLHLFTSVSDKLELYLYRQVSFQKVSAGIEERAVMPGSRCFVQLSGMGYS